MNEQEKILSQFEGKDLDTVEAKATEKERQFIKRYLETQNATACVLEVWPEKKWSINYVRVLASRLTKKFGLRGKNKEKLRQVQRDKHDRTGNGIVQHVKELYLSGAIDEKELFRRMGVLSEHSASDAARFSATKELRVWLKEAQEEVEANKLAMTDVVSLMISALSELPKEKYMAVLKGCRKRRLDVIAERTAIFDVEEIRKAERERIVQDGAREIQ
jgi:hypothetical protein